MCESKVVLHGEEIYLWKVERWERVVGGVVPTGYHHFRAQYPSLPPGLELIGARLTFQEGIMTLSAPTHLWVSVIGGPARGPCAESDYLVLARLTSAPAQRDKNIALRKTPGGWEIS